MQLTENGEGFVLSQDEVGPKLELAVEEPIKRDPAAKLWLA
jgi:hypothetical protein